MTDNEIEKVATFMERTWSNTYYKKDHADLKKALIELIADCEYKKVSKIIKDYAINYDNVPTVATITKLAHTGSGSKTVTVHRKYFEDQDGCGYVWNEEEKDYDCIWKYWWADQGKSKMECLKNAGVIDY